MSGADSLADVARSVARDGIAPFAERVDRERRFPAEAFAALGESGLMGLMVPTPWGGHGAASPAFAQVCEAVGGACASTGLVYLMHGCAAVAVAALGGEALRSTLEAAVAGRALLTVAFSTGSFAAGDRVEPASDGAVLVTVRRPFVSGGDRATHVLIIVGDAMYLLDTSRPGVRFEGTWDGLGMAGNNSTTLVVEGARLDARDRLTALGQGDAARKRWFRPTFLVGVSAVNVGIGAAALRAAAGHVRARTEGTALDAARSALGGLAAELSAARELTLAAAALADPTTSELPMHAKLVACETAIRVTQGALRICGGRGYTRALPVERHVRDALCGPVMIPTVALLTETVGRGLLERGEA